MLVKVIVLSLFSSFRLNFIYEFNVFIGKSARQDLLQILETVEKKSFTIEDAVDSAFFRKAMDAAYRMSDKSIGHKIHNIFLKGNNYQFIINAKQVCSLS